MTCPHCREFDETGIEPLINGYVKTGKVASNFAIMSAMPSI